MAAWGTGASAGGGTQTRLAVPAGVFCRDSQHLLGPMEGPRCNACQFGTLEERFGRLGASRHVAAFGSLMTSRLLTSLLEKPW